MAKPLQELLSQLQKQKADLQSELNQNSQKDLQRMFLQLSKRSFRHRSEPNILELTKGLLEEPDSNTDKQTQTSNLYLLKLLRKVKQTKTAHESLKHEIQKQLEEFISEFSQKLPQTSFKSNKEISLSSAYTQKEPEWEVVEFSEISVPKIPKRNKKKLRAGKGQRPGILSKFKNIVSKQNPEEPPPKRMNLGKSGGKYYDKVKKRWVFEGDEDQEEEQDIGAPPITFAKPLEPRRTIPKYVDTLGDKSILEGNYKPANEELEAKDYEQIEETYSEPEEIAPSEPNKESTSSYEQLEELLESTPKEQEIKKYKQLISELQIQKEDEVEELQEINQELKNQVSALNKAKSQNELKIQNLSWQLSTQHQEITAIKTQLNSTPPHETNTEPPEDNFLHLKLAQLENELLAANSSLGLKDLELAELKQTTTELEAKMDLIQKENERVKLEHNLEVNHFQEEKDRINKNLERARNQHRILKEQFRQVNEELENTRSVLEEFEMKVSILSEAKSKADVELKKAVFDKQQAEEEYQELIERIKELEDIKQSQEIELHNLHMNQLSSFEDSDTLIDFQSRLQQEETKNLKLQNTLLEHKTNIKKLKDQLEETQQQKTELQTKYFQEKSNRQSDLAELKAKYNNKKQVLKKTNQELNHNHSETLQENQNLHQKLSSLESENSTLVTTCEDFKDTIQQTKNEKTQLEELLEVTQQELNALKTHCSDLETQTQEYQSFKAKLESDVQLQTELRKTAEETLKQFQLQHQETLNTFEQEKQTLLEKTQQQQSELAQKEHELAQLTQKADSLDTLYNSYKSQLDSEINHYKEEIQHLQNEVSMHQSENSELTQEIEDSKQKLEVYEQEYEKLTSAQEENNYLKNQIQNLNKQIHDKEDSESQMQQKLQKLEQDFTYESNEKAQILREMNELKVKNAEEQTNITNNLQRRIEELSQQLNEALEHKDRVNQENSYLASTLQEVKSSLEQKEHLIRLKETQLSELETSHPDLSSLQEQNTELLQKVQKLESKKQDLKEQVGSLNNEISEVYEKMLKTEQEAALKSSQKSSEELQRLIKDKDEEIELLKVEFRNLMQRLAESKEPQEPQEPQESQETSQEEGWFSSFLGSVFLTETQRGVKK